MVSTPHGRIRARSTARGEVVCCIRPEALVMDAPQATNCLTGRVKDATYLGDQAQLALRLPPVNGEEQEILLQLHYPRGILASPGQEVRACFEPEDVIVVPA